MYDCRIPPVGICRVKTGASVIARTQDRQAMLFSFSFVYSYIPETTPSGKAILRFLGALGMFALWGNWLQTREVLPRTLILCTHAAGLSTSRYVLGRKHSRLVGALSLVSSFFWLFISNKFRVTPQRAHAFPARFHLRVHTSVSYCALGFLEKSVEMLGGAIFTKA